MNELHDELMNINATLVSMSKDNSQLSISDFTDEVEDLNESEEDLTRLSIADAYSATVSASDWTAETLLRQIERENIDLNPEFQRREAWTAVKQSRYIESLIVGLPVPQIVLAERQGRKGKFLVLDGKQRLVSMKKFMTDHLKLSGLDLRKDLNGKIFAELNEDDKNALENETLRTVTVRNWKSEDFLYLVFLRLNTASVPLSPQELRTALHPGLFVDFTNKFTSTHSEFARLFRKDAEVDFRMRDIELLIRYFSFSKFLPSYNGSLKDLLDLTCKNLNEDMRSLTSEVDTIAEGCLESIRAVNEVFGRNAFRLWNPKEDRYESRFNRAIFDVLTFPLQSDEVRQKFRASSVEVHQAFRDCCSNDDFRSAVTSTTKTKDAVNARISIWAKFLSEAINSPVASTKLEAGQIAYTVLS